MAIALALAVALRASLDVIVFGVILFGTAHVAFELRYVLGRYQHLLRSRLLLVASGVLAAIVLGRLAIGGPTWSRMEAVLLGALLAIAVCWCVTSRRGRALGLVAIALAVAAAVTLPGSWPVFQAHLHNLVPVVFLWEWSSRVARRPRRRFRALTLLWAVAVPLVLLSGIADGAFADGSPAAQSLAARSKAAGTAFWPGTDIVWAHRLVVVFAFLQLVHYVVWCWFLPSVGVTERARFESSKVGHPFRGPRLWLVIVGATAFVGLVAAIDYTQGRLLYTSFATYHAYLEFPILIALGASLAAGRAAGRDPFTPVPHPHTPVPRPHTPVPRPQTPVPRPQEQPS